MLKVNGKRLLTELEQLARIGRTAEGGVSRPAFSAADLEARAWFRRRVQAAGLQFRQDGAGNLSALLPAESEGARTLLVGSHLDSVPNGGRYDGALGVLAALEVLRTVAEAGLPLPVHLEAVSFTDEEGAVLGLLGSQAAAGQLTQEELDRSRGGGEALATGLEKLSLSRSSLLAAGRDPAALLAFVELHIEQGRRLEGSGTDIGVVDSIVGIRSHWLRFRGVAAHAGTMPMAQRQDALWGAAEFVRRAGDRVQNEFHPGVVNCGRISIEPGAFNIVPAEVQLGLEYRHGSNDQLDGMETALLHLAGECAQEFDLGFEAVEAERRAPAPMAESVMTAIEAAADKLALSHSRLMSFAAHDAQAMSSLVPSAMLFVPSVEGISHNPHERSADRDVINGADTLLHTLLELASRQNG